MALTNHGRIIEKRGQKPTDRTTQLFAGALFAAVIATLGLRGILPICPVANGFVKHDTLKARGVPVESTPKSPCIGSQIMNGRALMPPPVKSVIGVHTCVVAVVDVTLEPAGHC